jgi:hypothetical protein
MRNMVASHELALTKKYYAIAATESDAGVGAGCCRGTGESEWACSRRLVALHHGICLAHLLHVRRESPPAGNTSQSKARSSGDTFSFA